MKGLCQLVKLLYVDADFFTKPMSLTDKGFLTKIMISKTIKLYNNERIHI